MNKLKIIRNKVISHIRKKHPVRLHMSLILLAVTLSGALFSKFFLSIEMKSMGLRYSLSVILAYVILLILVRIWLWYVSPEKTAEPSKKNSFDGSIDVPEFSSSNAGNTALTDSFSGQGGQYGGGGATYSFDSGNSPAAGTSSINAVSRSSGGSSSSSGSFSLDGLDEGILIVLLIAAVAAVTGAWVYLIYEAPAILGEAAFEFGLGSSLFKKLKTMHGGDWAGSVFKSNIILCPEA